MKIVAKLKVLFKNGIEKEYDIPGEKELTGDEVEALAEGFLEMVQANDHMRLAGEEGGFYINCEECLSAEIEYVGGKE